LNDIVYHPTGELYLATARGLYHKAAGDSEWSKVEDTDFDLAELTGLLFTETNQGKLWINSVDGVFVYVIE
jgi:ligand-binding sensor domain-containing protein